MIMYASHNVVSCNAERIPLTMAIYTPIKNVLGHFFIFNIQYLLQLIKL